MTDLDLRLPNLGSRLGKAAWPRFGAQIAAGLIALLMGVALARLPILWACIGLLTAALLVLTVIEPMVGLGVLLILGPTKPLTDYFVPALPLDIGQLALIVTLGAWFLHAVRRRVTRIPASPFTVPLLLLIFVGGLSMVGALSAGYALKELIKWGQMLVVMLLVMDMAGVKHWRAVIGMVIAAGVLEALIGVWQFGLRGDGPEHFLILGGRFYRAYGTFEQPNPYGGFIGLILPLALGLLLAAFERWGGIVIAAFRRRTGEIGPLIRSLFNTHSWPLVACGGLFGLLLAALIMSWSRGAWIGFGAAALAVFFAWPRKAWIGVALVLVGLVVGVAALQFRLLPAAIESRLTGFSEFIQTFDVRGVDITTENYAVIERLAHWQAAQEMARYHWLFGVGIGNYEPVYPAYALMNWPIPLGHAHNIYLNLLAETGIIGLTAYLILWIVVIGQTWRATRGMDLWQRSVAMGMLGTWVHLSTHSMLDKLYVANIHLHLGALLGVLSIFIARAQENSSTLD